MRDTHLSYKPAKHLQSHCVACPPRETRHRNGTTSRRPSAPYSGSESLYGTSRRLRKISKLQVTIFLHKGKVISYFKMYDDVVDLSNLYVYHMFFFRILD